jgi:plasmid stabilization system protein ParE
MGGDQAAHPVEAMNLPLVFRPEVALEVDATYQWYESEREGLGAEFLDELEKVYDRISEFPEGPALIHRDIRVRATHRFPYGVYYRVAEDRIRVIAVVHLRRSARVWKSRLD